jgi:hypothetical protein
MTSIQTEFGPDADVRKALMALAKGLETMERFVKSKGGGLFASHMVMLHPNTYAVQQAAEHAKTVLDEAAKHVQYDTSDYEMSALRKLLEDNLPVDPEGIDRFRRLCVQIAEAVHADR